MAVSMLAVALFVVSQVLQAQAAKAARKRQKRLEREAKERADAAKGFQISAEGEASLLPIQYGRGKLAGVRVYHQTSNTFTNVAPATGSQQFINALNASRSGVKHEFLTVQTAVCFGDIQGCYFVTVDGMPYDNPKYGSVVGSSEYLDEGRTMGGHKIHFNPTGGVADPLLSANYGLTRPFTNTAYATSVFALNRDDYQYNGVPEVQFFVEGLKISTIVESAGNYSLSAAKTYSNNPALCLLDYLINPIYGRGLELKYIDLASFYYAASLCDITVAAGVPLDGEFWTHKGGVRDIKLYECNIALSPSASIRDNAETILETMGQAELIWSAGKYRLSIEYPKVYTNNTAYSINTVVQYESDLYRSLVATTSPVSSSGDAAYMSNPAVWTRNVIAAYLSDDDILRSGENTVAWPNAGERYNLCTVRFLNESKDFAEDSVSWPFRLGTIPGAAVERGTWSAGVTYYKSDLVQYLGTTYQFTGNNPSTTAAPPSVQWVVYDQNNIYNIYRKEDYGIPLESDFFEAGITDYYHALAKAEQRVRFSRSSTVYKFSVITKHINLEPGDIIKVTSDVLHIPGELIRIEEIKVDNQGNAEVTGSKFDAVTLAWNVADNEIVTPKLIFATEAIGQCTNLAFSHVGLINTFSAGRLTWTAPSDIRVKQFRIKYTLTPVGAITNTTVWTDIGVTQDSFFELPSMATNDYTLTVVADTGNGKMSPRDDGINSKWPELGVGLNAIVFDTTKFIPITVYKRSATAPDAPTGGVFDFTTLTLSTNPVGWTLNPPSGSDALYGSRAIAETVDINTPDTTLTWTTPVMYSDVAILASASKAVLGVGLDFDGNNAIYTQAFGNISLIVGTTDYSISNEASYTIISESISNVAVTIDNINGSETKGKYSVTNLTGLQGGFTVRLSFRGTTRDFFITVIQLKDVYIKDLTPPPTPAGITVTVGLNTVFIEAAALPTYTVGHGHLITNVYGAIGVSKVFADAVLIGSYTGHVSSLARNVNEDLSLWFKYVSIDGAESTDPFGGLNGIDAHTLLIGPDDIAANAITADKILAGAITADKILAGAITADKLDANAVNVNQLTLSNTGYLKGGQTAYATGNGFFLGYSGTDYKFSIGNNLTGIRWDGTDLAINGLIDGALTLNPSGHIKSGQTAYNTGDGFWVGNDAGTTKFSMGNSSQGFTWDGATLNVNGALVATGNVLNNAITNLVAAYTAGGVSFPSTAAGVYVLLQSVVITTVGSSVIISYAFGVNSQDAIGYVRLLRNGTEIYLSSLPATVSLGTATSGSFIDTPPAGTHTYYLYGKNFWSGSSNTAYNRFISVLELKR